MTLHEGAPDRLTLGGHCGHIGWSSDWDMLSLSHSKMNQQGDIVAQEIANITGHRHESKS